MNEVKHIRQLAGKKRIVFVSGNFNIVHPGHLRLLRFAKECGDFLVIGVNCDGAEHPGAILPEEVRLEGIKANIWVDYAFILRQPVDQFIRELKPVFVVKGKEHQKCNNIEKSAVECYGGTLVFSSGEASFSSLELLKLDSKTAIHEQQFEICGYIKRHKIEVNKLISYFQKPSGKHIAVIGESIIDEYINCEPLGLSREEPCMVVSPLNHVRFIGGAAIVAAHIATLGMPVHFFTLAGNDDAGHFLRSELQKTKISLSCFEDVTRPTIVKQRFRVDNRSLFRVSYLRQHEISQTLQDAVIDKLSEIMPQLKILVFSDFNYGLLTSGLIQKITALAMKHRVLLLADSQVSSQHGDITRYHNTKLLTPTEHEARTSLRDTQSGIVVLCEKLRSATNGENIFLKLGAEGMMIHAYDRKSKMWETDRLPSANPTPIDVAGAGDSILACSAVMLANGANIWEAALCGMVGAGGQISRIGNIPLRQDEIIQLLRSYAD